MFYVDPYIRPTFCPAFQGGRVLQGFVLAGNWLTFYLWLYGLIPSDTLTKCQSDSTPPALRRVPAHPGVQQATALEVFDQYFGRGMNGIVGTTLDILEERLSFRGQRR